MTINVRAGTSTSGAPVLEELRVEPCGDSTFRLLASPGLTLGLAAGDVINVDSLGSYQVVERGRNLCIQVFCRSGVEGVAREGVARFEPLGGRLDGKTSKELVFTVPVEAGFERVEAVLGALVGEFEGIEWFYGNVYDPVDGVTPLNWW